MKDVMIALICAFTGFISMVLGTLSLLVLGHELSTSAALSTFCGGFLTCAVIMWWTGEDEEEEPSGKTGS